MFIMLEPVPNRMVDGNTNEIVHDFEGTPKNLIIVVAILALVAWPLMFLLSQPQSVIYLVLVWIYMAIIFGIGWYYATNNSLGKAVSN